MTNPVQQFKIKLLDLKSSPTPLLPDTCLTTKTENLQIKYSNSAKFCRKCGSGYCPKRSDFCSQCRLIIFLAELLEKEKLDFKAWLCLQTTFDLPLDLNQVTAGKARFLREFLVYFVAHWSGSKQSQISEGKLLLWLIDNLPNNLRQNLKLFKLEKFDVVISSHRKIKPGSEPTIETSTKKNTDNKKSKNKKNRKKRRQLSNTKFMEVAARQGSYCYWCGIKVIREAAIPKKNRISRGNRKTIVYLSNGELREEAVATIDHLLRFEDGGNDQIENLVISCYICNIERDRITIAYGHPFARRKLPCHSCGGRFFHPDWGCCSICGAVPRQPNKLTSLFINFKHKFLKLFNKNFIKL